MNFYLDDDSVDPLFVQLLRSAGHYVRIPADIGQTGSYDAAHLRHAIRERRVLITGNHDDFAFLHDLILDAEGHHPGIFVVRRDNNPRRDMTPRGVVRAIENLLYANIPIADELTVLNHWR